jgi:hypothetical protein
MHSSTLPLLVLGCLVFAATASGQDPGTPASSLYTSVGKKIAAVERQVKATLKLAVPVDLGLPDGTELLIAPVPPGTAEAVAETLKTLFREQKVLVIQAIPQTDHVLLWGDPMLIKAIRRLLVC